MISLTMPADVREYVLLFQAKEKARKGLGKYSQQQAIIAIIREHMAITEANGTHREREREKP